jgi:ketosteroid isomerase-like protein
MPGKSTDADARHIFKRWHETLMKGDAKGIAELYAEDAVFESPAVWVLNEQSDGMLRGRQAIETYFESFLTKLGAPTAEWYRDGTYFFNGELLMWEYPRQAPHGNQNDIVESIDVVDGKIAYHRVYWGWVGVKNFVARMNAAAATK